MIFPLELLGFFWVGAAIWGMISCVANLVKAFFALTRQGCVDALIAALAGVLAIMTVTIIVISLTVIGWIASCLL